MSIIECILITLEYILTTLFDILKSPPLLIGIITMLGLILQKSPAGNVVKGTVKAMLGFVVLQGGAGLIVQSLDAFGTMFQAAFSIHGVVPNNEAITSIALTKLGQTTALIMVFGMLINILVARFTPMKYIFLTGHHTLFMAALFAAVLNTISLPAVLEDYGPAITVAIGSILLGFVMAFFPFLAQGTMRKITGGDDIALGHFGTIGYVVSAWIGKLVGKDSKSTEEMNLPKGLLFFRETAVSISLTMLVLFGVVATVLLLNKGPAFVHANICGEESILVYCIIQAITFAAGIYIILQGVRLILGEIVPAFKGISEKIVPNAKPALDCPIVFPFAQNAVIIGFISSFAGGLVGLAVCGLARWTLIVPGVIPHFFCGATAGVFGNATGGRRGCVAGAFVHGLIITFLPILLLPVLGELGFANTTFGDSDFGIVGTILGKLLTLLN